MVDNKTLMNRDFPTMAAVLAHPWLSIRELDTDLNWEHCLHAEQGLEFLQPLPVRMAASAARIAHLDHRT